MITEKIFYGLMCDRCREDFEGDEYSYMSDKGEIEETAENDDWRVIDGRHYCPCCYEEDPLNEEYDDDDHEYTPKPPIPECIFTMRRAVGLLIHQGDGEMRETDDDHLHIRFYMNRNPLTDAILLTINQLLGDLPHTVEVEEEKRDTYVTRRLHIDVTMNFIHKGDRVRVIKHSNYMDSFGLEGIVQDVRLNDSFCVNVEVNGEKSRRYFSRESIEVIKRASTSDLIPHPSAIATR